jgi:hypothetical protein
LRFAPWQASLKRLGLVQGRLRPGVAGNWNAAVSRWLPAEVLALNQNEVVC